ncbi:MAG: helix-turn-helix transcriptional regulator [Hyphomicrobiales bacterium]|nr:helix-turn-helix transcriptional regulator [Hyphomicrobiales bacterium]
MPVTGAIQVKARTQGISASERSDERDDYGAELARRIDATGHAAFALTRGARGGELVPIFRSDFPDIAPAGASWLAGCAQGSIRPFWWAREASCGLEGLRWASRVDGPLPGIAGVAFPVAARQDACGLVVFTGARFALSDQALPDFHGECFGLFDSAVRQHGGAPLETVSLTKRERECIRLAADGLSSEEMARALRLSLHTANQYLADAARKLNANGRMHAVAKALRLGLID